MSQELTVSVIKADVGGFVGHSSMHPALMEEANAQLEGAKQTGPVIDYHVTACGDDLGLVLTHEEGVDSSAIHQLAWQVFEACTETARGLKLYGAGQDLLADAFSGNVRGMGPGVAEMCFEARTSEPLIVFFADKTSAGAWNLPLYRMFADPFNTSGLVISPAMHEGFRFDVLDVRHDREVSLNAPEELYDLLVFIGSPGHYAINEIYSRNTGEIAAVSSTQKLALIAGKYVGKDDPVCVVRAQSQFPSVGELLEPFTHPHLVEGWMRGSHCGPLMPCRFGEANPRRFDGPPRVIALGFQVADGRLVGPQDMFDDPAFDGARQQCVTIADYLRRHGPFEPHRLPAEEMEYTTLPDVKKRLDRRWKSLSAPAAPAEAIAND